MFCLTGRYLIIFKSYVCILEKTKTKTLVSFVVLPINPVARKSLSDIRASLEVSWLRLPAANAVWAQVQYLVRELRSCIHMAWPKGKNKGVR